MKRRAIGAAMVLALAALVATPGAAQTRIPARDGALISMFIPVASSKAHRPDRFGNYGGLKSRQIGPRSTVPVRPSKKIKQPYPSRYYYDTNRSLTGCRWMARRAIATNNRNWWVRYRACTD